MIEFQLLSNAAFFGAVPALVALYMLKLNRRKRRIPSVQFVKGLVSENRGSSLFKRLTSNMLLFLEVLFLCLLVLALMNPGRSGQSLLVKKMVILVDNSITMSAREAGGVTRLAEAIEKAAAAVYDNPNSSVDVIEFSSVPRLLTVAADGRDEAVARIRSIVPTHLPPDYRSAIALAEGLCGEGEAPEVHIFSDFCSWRGSDASFSRNTAVFFRRVGETSRNAGVCALEVSEENASGGGAAGYDVFYTVKNYGEYEVSLPVSVFIDGKRSSTALLTLAPGARESRIVRKYGSRPASVSVEIISNDALAADDRRVWSSSGHKSFRALVVSEKPYFYRAALEAAGADSVDSCEPNIPRALYRQREYDLAVIDETAEAMMIDKYKCAGFIVFDPPSGFFGMTHEGGESDAAVRTPEFPFAYMRSVDLSDIYVHRMKKAVLNQNFSQIAYSSSSFPLFAIAGPGSPDVFAAFFDPRASNFPLKVSFPIFFSNVINIVRSKRITGDNFTAGARNFFSADRLSRVRPGAKLTLSCDWADPSLRKAFGPPPAVFFNVPAAGASGRAPVEAPELRLAGMYAARYHGEDGGGSDKPLFEFFVNPPAARAMSVKPYDPAGALAAKGAPASRPAAHFENSHVSFAAPLILMALLVLLLDWVYQNHRTFYKKEARR